jgi:hypothetical protein
MIKELNKAKRLEGTWFHPETSAEYTVRVLKTKISVSGVDVDDGEKFVVSDVLWDGTRLCFTTVMPSTKWRVTHRVTPNRGSTVRHEFTYVETWKKKPTTT